MIYTVKGFEIVNKAEIDVFLELSCFFDDSADVGYLVSGSSDYKRIPFLIHIDFTFTKFEEKNKVHKFNIYLGNEGLQSQNIEYAT